MKLLLISDTHTKHKQIPLEWLDVEDKENTVLIHAGDISNVGHLSEIDEFCSWYDSLDFGHKIFIAGNHDFGFEIKPKEVAEIIARYETITYLEDSAVVIDGVKIYGSPWQPRFFNWAFNLDRGAPLQEKWDMIDSDTNIIITHGPVHGLVDMTPDGEFVGCEALLDTIETKLDKVALHVCGHIHCANGFAYKNGRAYVNASILNEQYMVAYKPIMIEYDKENNVAEIRQ